MTTTKTIALTVLLGLSSAVASPAEPVYAQEQKKDPDLLLPQYNWDGTYTKPVKLSSYKSIIVLDVFSWSNTYARRDVPFFSVLNERYTPQVRVLGLEYEARDATQLDKFREKAGKPNYPVFVGKKDELTKTPYLDKEVMSFLSFPIYFIIDNRQGQMKPVWDSTKLEIKYPRRELEKTLETLIQNR